MKQNYPRPTPPYPHLPPIPPGLPPHGRGGSEKSGTKWKVRVCAAGEHFEDFESISSLKMHFYGCKSSKFSACGEPNISFFLVCVCVFCAMLFFIKNALPRVDSTALRSQLRAGAGQPVLTEGSVSFCAASFFWAAQGLYPHIYRNFLKLLIFLLWATHDLRRKSTL